MPWSLCGKKKLLPGFKKKTLCLGAFVAKKTTMKNYIHLSAIGILLAIGLMGCGVRKVDVNSNRKPGWVAQRPTNTDYYIGIGHSSKLTNSGDFQRVAKKNALDDMMGEIKVTVSSNSILSQYQNNQNFSQQFFSDTRMIASETMEGYQVLDSWEDKIDYWIYYRLSKADFEAYKRKKLYEALEKSIDLLNRADKLNVETEFVQKLQLRIKAAISLQNYLNKSIETDYNGRRVFLLNEILSQLQSQLYLVQIRASEQEIAVIMGKPLDHPIMATAQLKTSDTSFGIIPYLPLMIEGRNILLKGNVSAETQANGSAQFGISSIQCSEPIQVLNIKTNLKKLMMGDSVNVSMEKLLLNLDGPIANIRVKLAPIKIYMQSKELNLGNKMYYTILEPALKKKLMEKGCSFVKTPEQADYIIELEANTKDLGVMWGNMLRSTIDLDVVLKDAKTQSEIMHDAIGGIQGFQTTKEKAGLEAYKAMSIEMMKRIYPAIEGKIFPM